MLVVLFVLIPLVSWLTWPRSRARLMAGQRLAVYMRTIAWQWLLTLALLSGWLVLAPHWRLGLTLEGGVVWFALAVSLAVAGVLMAAQRRAASDPAAREAVHAQLDPLLFMLPHDKRELVAYVALSATAAICEEILYRGFLFELLADRGGALLALLGSTFAFTLAHLYQHPQGVVRVAAVGLVLGLVFWLSGSLWPCIVLHFAVDVSSGHLAYRVHQSTTDNAPVATSTESARGDIS
jgi:membrane protease YdiL (CAAX protease family)